MACQAWYLTAVSKLFRLSGSNFAFRAWAPIAPKITAIAPNAAAQAIIFLAFNG